MIRLAFSVVYEICVGRMPYKTADESVEIDVYKGNAINEKNV